MKYRYLMYGTIRATDGNQYGICIPSPFIYDSAEEAARNDSRLRCFFWLTDRLYGPDLVIYRPNGTTSEIVAIYSFGKFFSAGGYIRELQEDNHPFLDLSDCTNTDKSFDAIFLHMKGGREYHVTLVDHHKVIEIANPTDAVGVKTPEEVEQQNKAPFGVVCRPDTSDSKEANDVLRNFAELAGAGELPPLPANYACLLSMRYNIPLEELYGGRLTRSEAACLYDMYQYNHIYTAYQAEEQRKCRGNANLGLSLADKTFFDAIDKFEGDLTNMLVTIRERYVTFYPTNTENPQEYEQKAKIYDSAPDRIMSESAWYEHCGDWTFEEEDRRLDILKHKGLKEAWIALQKYLHENRSILQSCSDGRNYDGEPHSAVIERSLRSGYKLNSVQVLGDGRIVWGLMLYDRVSSGDDTLRGMDEVFVACNDDDHSCIYPVAKKTIKGRETYVPLIR